jgi:hypothetical protein
MELAEEPVGQVPQGSGVPVTGGSSAFVVRSGDRGSMNRVRSSPISARTRAPPISPSPGKLVMTS